MPLLIENCEAQAIFYELLNDFIKSFHINTENNQEKLSEFIKDYKVLEIDTLQEVKKEEIKDSNICGIITKKGLKCKNKKFKNCDYCKLHLFCPNKEKKIIEKELCKYVFVKGPRIGEQCNKLCDSEQEYCYMHKS